MASQGSTSQLDLEDGDVAILWLEAFEAKSRCKSWKDTEKNKAITDNFMAICGLQALKKISSIVAPKKVKEHNFSELKTIITNYLKPKERLTVAERCKFFERRQERGETITKFVSSLRELARYCKFEELATAASPIDEMIKMSVVAGLEDVSVKTKLLEKMADSTMSITQIVEHIQTYEQVKSFVSTNSKKVNAEYLDVVNYTDSKKPQGTKYLPPQVNNFRQNMQRQTYTGDRNNMSKTTSAPRCYHCNRIGHFARDCRFNQGFSRNRGAHYVEESEEVDGVFNVSASGSQHITILINSEKFSLNMLSNTGSSVTIISETMWKDIGFVS
jgi:hypothetical protein